MARTTHGIDRAGRWYFEVRINPGNDGHVRLGIAQILAQSQGPVGFDEYGYGIRDTDGCTVHCGRPVAYAIPFGVGSIIGVLLDLPEMPPQLDDSLRSAIESRHPPLKFGQYHVHQEILAHGAVSFYIDGIPYGVAFEHIYHGKYYPAVSLYGGASATLNLGPTFAHCLSDDLVRPACAITDFE